MKLFYTKTAVMKAPDQIRVYNNYYFFVEALLKEYTKASKGMVELEIVDPRPYSDEEAEALRYGIQKFPMTEEENFFFGLDRADPVRRGQDDPVFCAGPAEFPRVRYHVICLTPLRRVRKSESGY